jgi:hypothetical protein
MSIKEKDKPSYISNKYICQGPDKGILFIISFPKTLTELQMTGENAILDDFKTLP